MFEVLIAFLALLHSCTDLTEEIIDQMDASVDASVETDSDYLDTDTLDTETETETVDIETETVEVETETIDTDTVVDTETEEDTTIDTESETEELQYVADYSVSREDILRSIPEWAIENVKDNFIVLFNGTSHTSQILWGMAGLQQYKDGDSTLFQLNLNEAGTPGLDFRSGYIGGNDLTTDEIVDDNGHTQYFMATFNYLQAHPVLADSGRMIVYWGWCTNYNHDVSIYIRNYQELINLYPNVHFIWSTAYALGDECDSSTNPTSVYNNNQQILDYCADRDYFVMDFWTQDTYSYGDDYYDPCALGNDNIEHYYYETTHTLGTDWFECREPFTGEVSYPAHTDEGDYPQHITGNVRAYGFWWLLARIAGWDGISD